MMIDVITCILAGYDNLRAPVVRPERVRYLCYTDEPRFDVRGWQIQPALTFMSNPSHNSRLPKILSHLHGHADYTIWQDGCFRPQADPGKFVEQHLADYDLVAFEHPRKHAIREQEYCHREGYGNTPVIDQQITSYRANGYQGLPFVCGGIIGRRENAAVREFNKLWWLEYRTWVERGQSRDQFSLSYAIWASGLRVKVIEGIDILQNPWFSFHFHAWCEGLSDNPDYAKERERMGARAIEIREMTS